MYAIRDSRDGRYFVGRTVSLCARIWSPDKRLARKFSTRREAVDMFIDEWGSRHDPNIEIVPI